MTTTQTTPTMATYLTVAKAERPRNVRPSSWDAQWAADMTQASAALTDAELTACHTILATR
jgi:hypothetical protein